MNRIKVILIFSLLLYVMPSAYGMWLSVDPLADKYPNISPYAYCAWNPMKFTDKTGAEPVKAYIGTSTDFKALLDNSTHKVGLYIGSNAANYMENVGNYEIDGFKIKPAQTGYFNNKMGRYIYTKKGGWIDMAHFMFYAGRAYKYKIKGVEEPVSKAVKEGYIQENMDNIMARHSAFSYEDLPSDYCGAIFGGSYFDPDSEVTLGEQIKNFLDQQLQATKPTDAPNYMSIPEIDTKQMPSTQNKTTKPMYTDEY